MPRPPPPPGYKGTLPDRDEVTPIHVSTTQFPVWIGTAKLLADELSPHMDLVEKCRRLRNFAEIFERWGDDRLRPPSQDRSPIIREFMTIYKESLEELSKRGWKNPPRTPLPNDPRKR